MKYDFDFKHQKGSESGQWTCVGFTEKLYESANTVNPKDLNTLVYNPAEYGIDITPDGFDNYSVYNSSGDCFATTKEFSKISKRRKMLLPAPEIIGYDAGLEEGVDRYFFIPQTQFLQPTLRDVTVDIELESDFDDAEIRGQVPQLALIFKWSLINNPSSSLRQLVLAAKEKISNLFKGDTALAVVTSEGSSTSTKKVATSTTKTVAKAKTTKASTAKTSTAKKASNSPVPKATNVSKKVATPTIKTVSPRLNTTVQTKKATSSLPAITLPVNNPVPAVNPTVNNYNTTVVNNPEVETKPLILIGEIGEDWIELYNPNEEAVDLADGTYRLEKSKTTVDPGIMVRFGNESDGAYPGGVEISGLGSYLIVAADASSELLASAQAIVSNNNFSWGENGYTIYLGVGAISSNTDSDIIDFVGFGSEARYFEKNPTASLIPNSILVRKANSNSTVDTLRSGGSDESLGHAYDTNNNQSDFVLLNMNTVVVIDPEDEEIIDDPEDEEGIEDPENEEGVDEPISTSTEIIVSSTPVIIISRVSATGDDDFIDLYNDGDEDFDLAQNNYRLEKAKTASDPMILMRIGNENDGTYPGGVVIRAKSYYRILRDDASGELLATADAIASGTNFTFDGSGYSIYLGLDSISTPDDLDILDLVGFGYDAIYYEGSGPAPEILEEGILSRKVTATSTSESMALGGPEYGLDAAYDSDNNQSDFVIIGGIESPNDFSGYDSPGLAHLWHFNECRGNILQDSVGSSDFNVATTWRVGKWGCVFEQFYNRPKLQTSLAEPLSSSGISVAFNYLNSSGLGRTNISLSGDKGKIDVVFDPNFTEASGLPDLFRSTSIKWPADGAWHQGVFVLNGANDYWELYLDGERVHQQFFEAIFSKDFNSFEVGDNNGYNYLDELAIWRRALGGEEIRAIFLAQSEFAPLELRSEQLAPVKVNHWSFDERTDNIAVDDISGDNLPIDISQWVRVGHDGAAILHNMNKNRKMEISFSDGLKSDDLSLDFWWRNRSYSNEARGTINLLSGTKKLFGLVASPYRPGYYFNGNYGMISQGYGLTLPHDDAWHHVALVYDSYDYQLNFYVDGELKYTISQTWLLDEIIDKLEIYNENWEYEIDELSIWQGALKASQVKQIYQNETGGN
jgi:hypothetical protein